LYINVETRYEMFHVTESSNIVSTAHQLITRTARHRPQRHLLHVTQTTSAVFYRKKNRLN